MIHFAASKRHHRTQGDGRWFPADGEALRRMVDGFIDGATVPPAGGTVAAAIAPHAGYAYSGAVAGHTFRACRDAAEADPAGAPDTVVILGFSHRETFDGLALLGGDGIVSPLGETPLDEEAAELLAEAGAPIAIDDAPHRGEHSAENEIPFVQAALPGAALVVGLFGDQRPDSVDAAVAGLLALWRERRLLVVASTDLLHHADYAQVQATDRDTLARIVNLDAEGLRQRWDWRFQVCCGIQPVLTAMQFAQALDCRAGTLLCHRTSADIEPASRAPWVVGYGAIVFAPS